MSVILDYHFEPGDFYNEYQPKPTLFPRQLHSYVFQFTETPATYDSLKIAIENQFGKKFVLTKGIKDSEYAVVKEFEFDFLTVSPSLTIGIKRSKSEDRKNLVTIRFMYDLPLGKMGIHMGNF